MTVNNLPLGLLKDILKITFLLTGSWHSILLEDWCYLQKYTNFKELMYCHSKLIMFQLQKYDY